MDIFSRWPSIIWATFYWLISYFPFWKLAVKRDKMQGSWMLVPVFTALGILTMMTSMDSKFLYLLLKTAVANQSNF